MEKECISCHQIKDLTLFSFKDKAKGRLSNKCKSCDAVYQKGRLESNPDLVREQWRKAQSKYDLSDKGRSKKRKYLYGLTQERYEQMLNEQEHKCAICTKLKPLVVDHDHLTLQVRGLLCQNCNVGIGKLGDNLVGLKLAVQYLDKAGGWSVNHT